MAQKSSMAGLVAQRRMPDVLLVQLLGDWLGAGALPGVGEFQKVDGGLNGITALEFDATQLGSWDSRFVAFVVKCHEFCRERQWQLREEGLPRGVRGLLRLANAVPEAKEAKRTAERPLWLARVGEGALNLCNEVAAVFTFFGESIQAAGLLVRGRAQFRWPDAWLVMQDCGPQALGIVALINFLIGLILAFVGATSLAQFGASIYVADMVAIGTVREMGCIMTAIILCGRTGAAFAAQLGTMKVNEEIIALQTFGISAVEFLVLPRMIALILMMPLLCVFADLISIAGGYFVSVVLLDVTSTEYLHRTIAAIKLKSFLLGVVKGSFFGFLVAYTGCLRGMQCGNNAAAVGVATTRAVVAGITAIIAADGLFAVLCNALGI